MKEVNPEVGRTENEGFSFRDDGRRQPGVLVFEVKDPARPTEVHVLTGHMEEDERLAPTSRPENTDMLDVCGSALRKGQDRAFGVAVQNPAHSDTSWRELVDQGKRGRIVGVHPGLAEFGAEEVPGDPGAVGAARRHVKESPHVLAPATELFGQSIQFRFHHGVGSFRQRFDHTRPCMSRRTRRPRLRPSRRE